MEYEGHHGKNLINFQGVSTEESGISRDDIPKLDADDVSWDEDCRFLLAPLATSKHLCVQY